MPFSQMRALIAGSNANVEFGLGRSGVPLGRRPIDAVVALASDLTSVLGISPITLVFEPLEAVLAFAVEVAVGSAIEVRLRRRLLAAANSARYGTADNPAQFWLVLVWQGGHGAAPGWTAASRS
jgi:hypothetical protein